MFFRLYLNYICLIINCLYLNKVYEEVKVLKIITNTPIGHHIRFMGFINYESLNSEINFSQGGKQTDIQKLGTIIQQFAFDSEKLEEDQKQNSLNYFSQCGMIERSKEEEEKLLIKPEYQRGRIHFSNKKRKPAEKLSFRSHQYSLISQGNKKMSIKYNIKKKPNIYYNPLFSEYSEAPSAVETEDQLKRNILELERGLKRTIMNYKNIEKLINQLRMVYYEFKEDAKRALQSKNLDYYAYYKDAVKQLKQSLDLSRSDFRIQFEDIKRKKERLDAEKKKLKAFC